jgi:glycosyltransferase involved in cell wall biosynthesis
MRNDYRHYFPRPISGNGTFLAENLRLTPFQKISYIKKMFHNGEVESKLAAVLSAEKPDIVYTIYLSSSFIPKILHIAKRKFNTPVVYRLSDFHMFCPSYLFFRNGNVCTDCLTDLGSAVKHKCVQNSTLASLLRSLQIKLVRYKGWYDSVDTFVCPSRVMANYLIGFGYSKEKVVHLPTFAKQLPPEGTKPQEPYILYFGKLTREKGVEVLMQAYNSLPSPACRLRLVGHCSDNYREYLLSLLDGAHLSMVSIEKPLGSRELWQVVSGSTFVVHPALWLENMPNTVLEAMSAGKPVIASDIGSLTEIVEEGVNGYLVEPGNVGSLASAMERLSDEGTIDRFSRAATRKFHEQYTEEVHLEKILSVFNTLIARK